MIIGKVVYFYPSVTKKSLQFIDRLFCVGPALELSILQKELFF